MTIKTREATMFVVSIHRSECVRMRQWQRHIAKTRGGCLWIGFDPQRQLGRETMVFINFDYKYNFAIMANKNLNITNLQNCPCVFLILISVFIYFFQIFWSNDHYTYDFKVWLYSQRKKATLLCNYEIVLLTNFTLLKSQFYYFLNSNQ